MEYSLGTVDLDTLKARATRRIDRETGRIRGLYLTDITGQDVTYTEKLADCRAWQAADNPDVADHPWVAGEAAAQDMSPDAAAQFVIDTYSGWRPVGVAIEQARQTAKRLIRTAGNPTAVDAAEQAGWSALQAYLP